MREDSDYGNEFIPSSHETRSQITQNAYVFSVALTISTLTQLRIAIPYQATIRSRRVQEKRANAHVEKKEITKIKKYK